MKHISGSFLLLFLSSLYIAPLSAQTRPSCYDTAGIYQSPANIITAHSMHVSYSSTNHNFSSTFILEKMFDWTIRLSDAGTAEQNLKLYMPEPNRDFMLKFNGIDYYLVECHFHRPGEHEIDGQGTEMEMHMVYKPLEFVSSASPGLVIGVRLKLDPQGNPNPGFNTALLAVFRSFTIGDEKTAFNPNMFRFMTEFPNKLSFFVYDGSLTTYPYTEGYTWVVLDAPLYITQEVSHIFRNITRGNKPIGSARPIQHKFNSNRPLILVHP